jgi:hypothetical protein
MITLLMATLIIFSQQDDCGNGLPCGPVPWTVPNYPIILSPTPFPTTWIQTTPTPTATPETTETATPTLTPTAEPTVDSTPLYEAIEELEDFIGGTREPVVIDGHDFTLDSLADRPSTETFWSYLAGLFSVEIGKSQPFLNFAFYAMGIVLVTKSITFVLPVLAVVYSVLLKVVDTVVGLISRIIRGG